MTRAEINLAHVRHNLHELRACLDADAKAAGRARAAVWGVLKADGYGHGAAQIGRTLEQAGVEGLCVALLEEGIELRSAGVRCPILVMGGYYGQRRDAFEALAEHGLTPVVYDAGQIERIATAQRFVHGEAARMNVHLKLDTGMGRLGVRESELDAVLRALRSAPALQLEGVMTHLACADGVDLDDTGAQLARFEALAPRLAAFRPVLRHAANSAAMFRMPSAQLDMVRPGIALFGVHPCPERAGQGARPPRLKPAMSVLSEIVALRDIPAGEAIGYGHTWRAQRASRVATIAMGYADGLSRALSNAGHVLVQGRRVPIVGTVSMDLTMIDVTDVPQAAVRDQVVVLGEQRGPLGDDRIGADEVAALTGTISWEILTSISRRVPRFYRSP